MYPDVFAGGYGPGYGPEAFMAWASSLESFIMQNQVSSLESLSLAVSLLRGEAKAWWRVEKEARWYDEEPIYTWSELKIVMSFKYLPGFQWEEKEPDFDFFLEEIEQPDSLPEDSVSKMAVEQEGETQELCLYVPDQTKKKEEVLGESSTASESVLVLVNQGVKFSVMDHLRAIKGWQQVVFEPGGSLSASRRSNNKLAQKTVSYKLDLQGFFTPEKQDLRSNLFEGREDGVILSSCYEKGRESGGNTFLIRPLTDQNKLRSIKQKLVVVKEIPKLENEYEDHYTRPPDPMQHENQVIMSIGQGVLREIRGILLGSQKELVHPPV
ncbi:uncharacterized protein LOC130506954 [Raphanus sativus]|uniref:Uncharacterized protein LOC130506954 n=1 Tax=Raphanus sativus TaxID=3726 RepID=A0A9W3D1G4_RAPSA|nr:uncharacterized protein LOC130506954 [Raphanus sativus]